MTNLEQEYAARTSEDLKAHIIATVQKIEDAQKEGLGNSAGVKRMLQRIEMQERILRQRGEKFESVLA